MQSSPDVISRFSAAAATPTRVRFSLIAILLVTIFVAYLDRANISVLVANDEFQLGDQRQD